jgi:hypothetical protein
MRIQGGPKAANQGCRAGPGPALRSCRGATRAQMALNRVEQDAQGAIDCCGVVSEVIAQPLGQRQHPLTHRLTRKYMVRQLRGGLDHTSRAAAGADTPPFAGKRRKKS